MACSRLALATCWLASVGATLVVYHEVVYEMGNAGFE